MLIACTPYIYDVMKMISHLCGLLSPKPINTSLIMRNIPTEGHSTKYLTPQNCQSHQK